MFVFDQDLVYHTGKTDEIVSDFQVYTRGEQSIYTPELVQTLPEETEIILCTSRDHEHLAEVHQQTTQRFGQRTRVLFSHPYGLDIMPHGSKSQALAWLAARLGILQTNVIAVGDGDNDVDMLCWAGLGIAIGDGTPAALAQADVVAPPFEQDGLAWAIQEYVLRSSA
jgi:HAD superfamily hydrolase (TIGR01484 family)